MTLSQYIPTEQNCFAVAKDFTVKLSQRQREVLFFILRGRTAKDIAETLELAPRTIEYYINIIKEKFGCRTKPELIDKAIGLGHMEDIPYGIFQYL